MWQVQQQRRINGMFVRFSFLIELSLFAAGKTLHRMATNVMGCTTPDTISERRKCVLFGARLDSRRWYEVRADGLRWKVETNCENGMRATHAVHRVAKQIEPIVFDGLRANVRSPIPCQSTFLQFCSSLLEERVRLTTLPNSTNYIRCVVVSGTASVLAGKWDAVRTPLISRAPIAFQCGRVNHTLACEHNTVLIKSFGIYHKYNFNICERPTAARMSSSSCSSIENSQFLHVIHGHTPHDPATLRLQLFYSFIDEGEMFMKHPPLHTRHTHDTLCCAALRAIVNEDDSGDDDVVPYILRIILSSSFSLISHRMCLALYNRHCRILIITFKRNIDRDSVSPRLSSVCVGATWYTVSRNTLVHFDFLTVRQVVAERERKMIWRQCIVCVSSVPVRPCESIATPNG